MNNDDYTIKDNHELVLGTIKEPIKPEEVIPYHLLDGE